jgi:hypothetical protein
MKKLIIGTSIILFFPFAAFAVSFDRDLYFGLSGSSDVTQLQDFLTKEGVYEGPITGNFFTRTKEAVKKFQTKEGITPALGYFGKKTRIRASEILSKNEGGNTRIIELEKVIQSLEAVQRLYSIPEFVPLITQYKNELQVLKGTESTPPPVPQTPSPSPAPAPSPVPAPLPPFIKELRVSGSGEAIFPIALQNPLQIGDITIENTTDSSVFFSQIFLKITDQMNSPANRGREVFMVLRDGATVNDPIISSTKFTFNSTAPVPSPHTYTPGVSYPISLASGARKTVSLWMDNFEYVISGALTFEFHDLPTTSGVSPVGGFRFVLRRD